MATPIRTIRVADELWAAAQAQAEARGESVTDALTRALVRYTQGGLVRPLTRAEQAEARPLPQPRG